MTLPAKGWKNKGNTSSRQCKCGAWKEHWQNFTNKSWPEKCACLNCNNGATLGAHVFNTSDDVTGEWIAPFCSSCNNQGTDVEFTLKSSTTLIPANQQKTCKK